MSTVVIDTNIFVNALLKGKCRFILEALISRKFNAAVSVPLVDEIIEVCLRPKFRKRIDRQELEFILAVLKDAAKLVNPSIKLSDCRDKNDNMILECALTADAEVIVTKDIDLLVLNPYRGILILSPEEFLKYLGNV